MIGVLSLFLLVICVTSPVFAATIMKQQSGNIPIVVPFEINAISNTGVYGTIGENSMFVEGDDKVFNNFSVMTSTSTNETTGVGHYYYNLNSSSTGNQGYPELPKYLLEGIHSSHESEGVTNQYIVLLKPDAVSASDPSTLTQQAEEVGEGEEGEGEKEELRQQRDKLRLMTMRIVISKY